MFVNERAPVVTANAHARTHTHTYRAYQRKTRVYGVICYRIQGVTLIYICMWSAMEYGE